MKSLLKISFICSIFFFLPILAEDAEPEPYVTKEYLILLSTKDYREALEFSNKASKQFKIKLDLRNLTSNEKLGLSFSEKECNDGGFDFPCYISRGRSDDGEYISIEYSDAFTGFNPKYYIVVAASGSEKTLKPMLKKVKKEIKDAYIKKAKVYIGCMH
jgi:hypothetical protein